MHFVIHTICNVIPQLYVGSEGVSEMRNLTSPIIQIGEVKPLSLETNPDFRVLSIPYT